MANEDEIKRFYRDVKEMNQLGDEINQAIERLDALRGVLASKHDRMRKLNQRWLDTWDGRLDELRDELKRQDLLDDLRT